MTLMRSTSQLTTVVDQLIGEANVTKAQLDAKVALANAAVVATQAEQTATEAARDEAATQAAGAATHLATVKAGVIYQGISAIIASKAMTAVDVFVYDTSLDSDGGAWRKRCQHTSWYNEALKTATRGARREFPAVAVIVAETGKVTIYDGDDPSLPMWMVFGLGVGSLLTSFNSVSMRNGIMCAGSPASINFAGLLVARFLNDDAIGVRGHVYWNLHMNVPSISARNGTWQQTGSRGFLAYSSTSVLVSPSVNDVAMTVLPDAPVDPATGLPVPTIAVATAGGVSVIKDDGSIWDITFNGGWGSNIPHVKIVDGNLYFEQSIYYWLKIPFSAVTQDYVIQGYGFSAAAPFVQMMPGGTGFSSAAGCAAENAGFELAYSQGNTRRGLLLVGQDKQLQANAANDFTSGWLVGATRGAWLASVSNVAPSGAEMVVNGGFDADTDWSKGAGWSISGGAASADGTQTSNSNLQQTLSPVAGKTYAIRVNVLARGGGASAYFYWGTTSLPNITEAGEYTFYYTWNGGSPTLYFTVNAGVTVTIDDISIVEADADRYTANKGLIVNGTITRSPVADGAELVGYSGFSAANYLEQPYNSALNFGTGDFCVMGWVRQIAGSAGYILERRLPDGTGNYIRLYLDGNTVPVFGTNGRTLVGSRPCGLNQWAHVCCLREGTDMAIYVNGVLDTTVTGQFDVTSVGAVLRFGRAVNVSALQLFGDLALWRISATAPSADQISKIYEDERKLFMPGAQCTLYGTSDAVNALAHDPKTNLLHVGTSQGRSVFEGLRRVANTETPVTTAISAVNGLIVEE